MPILRNILRDVLSDKSDYCCICFNAIGENETIYNFEDEISMGIEIETTKVLHEMICTVLGYSDLDNIFAHNIVCQKCTGMVINCYKFIQQCKQNIEQLHSTIDSLQKHTQESVANYNDYKSLFVALDTSNYNVEFYHHRYKKCNNQTELYKRFQNLRFRHKKKSALNKNQGSILQSIDIADISDMAHDEADQSNLICKICSKVYFSSMQMKYHFLTAHTTKEFKCSKCPKSFGTSILLSRHIKHSHATTNNICSQCGKTYSTAASLRLHEERHQLGPLVCQTCGKVYKDKLSFNKHITKKLCHKMRNINAGTKISCAYCGKKYAQRANLNVHIRTEHEEGRSVICDWCGKKFSCMSRLQDHIVTHTKQKNFECGLCGGKFVSRMSLLYHTRRHTGETPYKCEFCDKTFLSASRRTEHVKRTHITTDSECDICYGKFKGSKNLAQHRKKHFNVKSRLYSDRPASADSSN